MVREISRIDRFLRQEGMDPRIISDGVDSQWTAAGRPLNRETKMQVLRRVLEKASKPLTPREMVFEMKREGYVFASVNPANTLNPLLYGSERRLPFVDKVKDGFILVTRRAEFVEVS